MPARDTVGSIRRVAIDGTTYRASGEADFEHIGTEWENDALPTSGQNMRQMKKRVRKVSNVNLLINGDEFAQLITKSEQQGDVTLSFTTAAGDTWTGNGWFNLEPRKTMNGETPCVLMPRDNRWEYFAGA